MIEADLAVVDAAELVTIPGPAPKIGPRLAEAGVVSRGCLAARDGLIVFVGDEREYRRQVHLARHGVEIDATGRTVLPGFVDPHTHLPFAGSRENEFVERLEGATYESIAARGGGILATVRATRQAGIDDLVRLGKGRLDIMLRHGTTTVEAKSGYGLRLEDELKQLRAVQRLHDIHPVDLVPTFLGAHVVPPEWGDDRAGYVREVAERMIPEVAREGLARYCDVFVERGAFTVEEAERILDAASRHGLGLRLHAEQRSAGGGARLAARLGAASADHLEHVTEEGIEALREAGTTAVLLPGASFFLREARDAPARRLIEAGVPVALATDCNPGTCPTEAMTAILPLACLRLGMRPAEAIAAATLNAAHALGLAASRGSLEVGKAADLQVVDVPNHLHLAYHFGVNHCRTVIKDGRVVVEDGSIRGRDGNEGGARPGTP
ncbi:MAG: imidazolonepropionase [Acidobacteria bacterium]|nr:MAG: imidazolonepropionase [Acidobacteriota bacterium]